MQLHDLLPRARPQLGVEIAQWLVHQERPRLPHDGPPQRHPLPLPPRKLARPLVQQMLDPQRRRHPPHIRCYAPPHRRLTRRHKPQQWQAPYNRQPSHRQRNRQVLRDGQMRIERIILEHHRHIAVRRP